MKYLVPLFVSFSFSPMVLAKVCTGYGPQRPRDISNKAGTNTVGYNFAPSATKLNLCNVHFHKNAEHKGPEFSPSAGKGEFGGFKCNQTSKLTQKQLLAPKKAHCKNLKPGDTIEVHWVHCSCDVKPGPGLGSCLSQACGNPQLRVETQIYLLANDPQGVKLTQFDYGKKVMGIHQAKKLPAGAGAVEFLGSTKGPSFTEAKCSPLQVTWSVRPSCAVMDINSVHAWCKNNVFDEKKAHGVRQLVTNKKLLSKIK